MENIYFIEFENGGYIGVATTPKKAYEICDFVFRKQLHKESHNMRDWDKNDQSTIDEKYFTEMLEKKQSIHLVDEMLEILVYELEPNKAYV